MREILIADDHPLFREALRGAVLREWLNLRVGKHERVDDVVVRESMPKTMIGKLDRALEFLPTDEELNERASQGRCLTSQ